LAGLINEAWDLQEAGVFRVDGTAVVIVVTNVILQRRRTRALDGSAGAAAFLREPWTGVAAVQFGTRLQLVIVLFRIRTEPCALDVYL